MEQAWHLIVLTSLLPYGEQPDTAEGAAFRAIDLLAEKGEQFLQVSSRCRQYISIQGDTRKAIHHFKTALGIASSFDRLNVLFHVHLSLPPIISNKGKFYDAHTHVEHAKSHAVNDLDRIPSGSSDVAAGWLLLFRSEATLRNADRFGLLPFHRAPKALDEQCGRSGLARVYRLSLTALARHGRFGDPSTT